MYYIGYLRVLGRVEFWMWACERGPLRGIRVWEVLIRSNPSLTFFSLHLPPLISSSLLLHCNSFKIQNPHKQPHQNSTLNSYMKSPFLRLSNHSNFTSNLKFRKPRFFSSLSRSHLLLSEAFL